MNKNSVIGWILIGAIMLGFMWFQSKQFEKQVAYQAQQDSIAAVERMRADSIYAAEHPFDSTAVMTAEQSAMMQEGRGEYFHIYKDTLLASAASRTAELVTLQNDKIEVTFTTKGAQPASVKVKDYYNYGGSDLYLFKEGGSEMGYEIYAGELVNTKDFVFDIVEKSDTAVAMRLTFMKGGYIEQRYSLKEGSYKMDNRMSFVDMDREIPRNVSFFDMDWNVTVPRMEKGYKNESTYSKLDYYFSGDKKPLEMGRGRSQEKKIDNKLSWFAFQQQFFSVIMTSKSEFESGSLGISFMAENDEENNLMACSASMRQELGRGNEYHFDNEFYMGPNHFRTLKSMGNKYEKIIPLGGWLVGWFTRFVIIPLFDFLHKFISNFGIIILLMTIFIKLVVLPFSYKSYASSAKMQALKPWMDKINEKYPKQEDALKKQQATMELYQKAGISPMGGCLPMLLQFPILWAMFRFFPASIELRQQNFLWAEDLSAYDSIVDFGTRIPLLGDHISLFALLMALSMFFYSKITMKNTAASNDPTASSMQFMSVYMMPIMMFFICNSLSSGLSYYYLLSNLITMLETWVIRKWCVKPEAIAAKIKAAENKPAPKSKWQQRLEEAQKMQEQALREQRKKQR